MIEDICKFIAGIESDPKATVFEGYTVGEYLQAIKECRAHVKECKRREDALDRICNEYPDELNGPTTTLN